MNMNENKIFFSPAVTPEQQGQRLDRFLAACFGEMSRSQIQRLVSGGNLSADDGLIVDNAFRVRCGDIYQLEVPAAEEADPEPEDIPLDVAYEDRDLIVVNKPAGMTVHPAPGAPRGTLVNALLFHCRDNLSGIGGVKRPGIVHRIDKDTSGLLMVAKNDFAHVDLARQIQEHSFHRAYQAVVYGNVTADSGTVCQPIGRSPKDRKKMAVTQQNSKPATTHYRVLERFGDFTHIRCVLETGRTHQIRVHMAYIGHPLAGDPVYGPRRVITSLGGQCLHAGEIGFIHPRTGAEMRFEAPLPPYFTSFLHTCREKKR